MPLIALPILGLLAGADPAAADPPASPMAESDEAARRFPQPVRVGDLLHARVIQPIESQPTLGHVRGIVSEANGTLAAIIDYGGVFGFFTRPVAVPIDAMTLLGREMEIVGLTPAQVAALPTADMSADTPLAPGQTIRVGLAKPPH